MLTYVPGTMLSDLYSLFNLILTSLYCRYYYHLHFTLEKTEA